MSLLEVQGVAKKLHKHTLLDKTGFKLKEGEKLGIVGETGSGKTTLLKIIAGLIQPTSGKVLFRNKKVLGPDEQLIPGHPRIGYLSQHFELPKFITVEDHIFDSYKISEEAVDQLYATCDIKHLIHKDTQQLSGGEKQRVALARILRDQPELLLLDEPFSNLDLNHQRIIKEVLNNLETAFDTTLIVVSHDPQDILSWADHILVMKEGKIIQSGDPQELYDKPKNEYIAGLFGDYNLIQQKALNQQQVHHHVINGNYLVRPAQIKLNPSNTGGLQGNIESIKFMGENDSVKVKVNSSFVIQTVSSVGKWKVGDKVSISFIE